MSSLEGGSKTGLYDRSFEAGRSLGHRLLDTLMPPRCLRCGALVSDPGALCGDCFDAVTFVTPPFCDQCGLPFLDTGSFSSEEIICGACIKHPPVFDRARAVFLYDANSRPLVTRFKFSDRTDHAPALARWMNRAGSDLLEQADVLVPVPLHRWHLIERTYNQSTLLVRHLSRLSGVVAAFHVLRRTKATPRQGNLSASARRRNVAGAFGVHRKELVDEKRIVLVDDVLTTGATLDACARALKNSGAKSVDALIVGRVPASSR